MTPSREGVSCPPPLRGCRPRIDPTPMSPLALLATSAFVLALPWLVMPGRGPRPEIHGALRALWWLNRLYCGFLHRLELPGLALLPEHGPALLVANHTCGIDHMILQAGCRRVLGFLIAQEFYNYWAFHPICRVVGCIPVRRDGHD